MFRLTEEAKEKLHFDFVKNMFLGKLGTLAYSTGLSNGHPLGIKEITNEEFDNLMGTKEWKTYKEIDTDFSHYLEESFSSLPNITFKAVAIHGDEYVDCWIKNREEWSDRTDKVTSVFWSYYRD